MGRNSELSAKRLWDVAEKMSQVPDRPGMDKVVSLQQAIQQNVKPGMSLMFEQGVHAIIYQILREFRARKPEFTAINLPPTLGFDLVHCGLVKRLIVPRFGEAEPRPHISRIFQRAVNEKAVDLQIWSLGVLYQRLLAGALDVRFMPTRFMIGTTMAKDNHEHFRLIDDPFGSGERVAVAQALNPDLCLVHVLACDQSGNAICPDYVAAFASTQGVILTTERLVSTDFIRKHSSLVRIPGYLVRSVSVAPLGAHPMNLFNMGLDGVENYASDTDFLNEHYEASGEPTTLDAWLEKWVFDCPTHEDYLGKIGHKKIASLTGKEKSAESEESRLASVVSKVKPTQEYNPVEMMIIAASREAVEASIRCGHKVVLCGLGISAMVSFLAYYQLGEKDYDIELTVGGREYGLVPCPGDPFLKSLSQIESCKMLADHLTGYPLVICGKNRRSLGILGAAQIDKHGNINSAKVSEKVYVMGPGGGADTAQASEVLVVTRQSKERFLDKLEYVTAVGDQVRTLISDLGVFQKIGNSHEFSLVGCLPTPRGGGLDEAVKRAKDNCGWDLQVSPNVKELAPPAFSELMTIRLLDPDDYFRH